MDIKQFLRKIWWGTRIEIPYPSNTIMLDNGSSFVYKLDPNSEVKQWMDKNVGSKGFDWDWEVIELHNNRFILFPQMCKIILKFRRGKGKFALMALLKYKK